MRARPRASQCAAQAIVFRGLAFDHHVLRQRLSSPHPDPYARGAPGCRETRACLTQRSPRKEPAGGARSMNPNEAEASSSRRTILFDDWAADIRAARTHHELLDTVRAYLAVWSPQQLARLPADLGS